MKRILLGTAFTIAMIGAAQAGPFSDFETDLRETYGTYRVSLFKTNSGDQAASASSMEAFSQKLDGLIRAWRDAPPPQYSDDPLWDDTLARAARMAADASARIAAGDLAAAHEVLEGIREVFGDLHARNGIETFSDRMNAYHAEMEHVLGLDMSALDEAMMSEIHERAAVLDYLANDILASPPADAKDNPEYAKLAAGFEASVKGLVDAARSGDPEKVKAAVAALKKPYSMLFLNFG